MIWADIIRQFPEYSREIAEDVVMLDWGYEHDSDFPAAGSPHRRGRDVVVCPGTSGWNRLIPGLNNAETNTQTAARVAVERAAAGLMVTEWGDDGHFNLLSCSMPAILRSAALAWNGPDADSPDLDSAIELILFGSRSAGVLDAVRDAGRPGDGLLTWRLLYQPIDADAARQLATLDADAMDAATTRCQSVLDQAADLDSIARLEWSVACEANRLLARKVRMAWNVKKGTPGAAAGASKFRDAVGEFSSRYAEAWRCGNRTHRLEDVETALAGLSDVENWFVRR